MTYNEISAMIMGETNDIIYISDLETYELRYLNQAAIRLFHFQEESQWMGLPCYRLLQGRESPCPFCTNHLLTDHAFYVWEHYNTALCRYFSIKDKRINLDGRPCRLELATDITEKELSSQQLCQKLLEEKTLVSCIQTLDRYADAQKAIGRLLEIVGGYYGAERSYIFERDGEQLNNTYEWCHQGVESQRANLQDIPFSVMGRWVEQFERSGAVFITSLSGTVDERSPEYQLLASQGIESLMAAPLYQNGELVGFLGVDNPRENTGGMTLLRSVASFVVNDIAKRKLMERLTLLSYTDALTGAGNRHSYIRALEQLGQSPPTSLGILFSDINRLKTANDTHGHQYGDYLIHRAARTLRKLFGECVYRVGGDEFVVLCAGIGREDFEAKVQELHCLTEADRELQISIGAGWSDHCADISGQIAYADGLMYIDKQKTCRGCKGMGGSK